MNDLSKARATILEVGEESDAQRLDNFLLRRLKGVPKSHVYRVVRSGEVRVNSGRVKAEYRLVSGDRVRVPPVRIADKQETASERTVCSKRSATIDLWSTKQSGLPLHTPTSARH